MNTEFEYIDEVLAELEDTIHGNISDKITIARGKLQALSLLDVSDSIIVSKGSSNNTVQITSHSKWFDVDEIVVLHDIDCIIIKRPELDFRGKTHKLQKNYNTVQTMIVAEIPFGRYKFDKESDVDKLVVYYR